VLADSSFRKNEEQSSQHVKFVPLKAKQFSVGIRWQELKKNPFPDCPKIPFQGFKSQTMG